MRRKEWMIRIVVFFIGIMMMSLGIALTIEANLGVSPWDVLHIGLTKTLGLTVGTWSQLVGIMIIASTYFIDKKILSVGTVLNMIFVGWFIDLSLFLLPTMDYWVNQLLFLALGIILSAAGAGMYITSKLGAGPRDGLMLVLSQKWNKSIRRIKTTMEIIVLSLGWFLGGPVFIGTVLTSLTIGPMMQFFIEWWNNRLEQLVILKEKENVA